MNWWSHGHTCDYVVIVVVGDVAETDESHKASSTHISVD